MGGDVGLRPSRPSDLAWITALERRQDHVAAIGQWSDAEHAAAIAGEAGREHWIVERDGERAGYLIAYGARAATVGFYVKRVLVDAKDRGTGTAALRLFLEGAFARGARAVWLHVREGNARALAVYRRLGFEVVDTQGAERAAVDEAAEPQPRGVLRMRVARI